MAAPLVAFSGSRRLSAAFAPVVRDVVAAVMASGRGVAVGDARGADAFVRAACPTALIFHVSAFGDGSAAYARRSIALVQTVAESGDGAACFVFPALLCPPGLMPSADPSRCFRGLGSGTWATAALAAGRGLPVVVFPCGFSPSALPAWGAWAVAGSGVWASGLRLVAPGQISLF